MPLFPPTRLSIDPSIDPWRVTPRNGRTKPVIATGHQPTLWHPGILAKYLAADVLANRFGGSALHVSVEHNPVGAVGLDVPTQQGGSLGVRRLLLDQRPNAGQYPPNRLAALSPEHIGRRAADERRAIGDVPAIHAGLERLANAYAAAGGHTDLAAQTVAVLAQLYGSYLSEQAQTLPTSELVTEGFVDRLLADPVGCVRCYNRAVTAHPQAGVRPLYLGRDVVEAPLWAQGEGACTPVFIDLGDSGRPELFTQGQSLDLTGPEALRCLRPRALSLSAIMRSEHCDLFIHGSGGGAYDQASEQWWRDWAGAALAPMLVVSADVFLPFDVPVSTHAQLARAVWFDHHLPFNVDRFQHAADDAEQALRDEKQQLLERMADDRDRRRRAKAFQRIHEINVLLQAEHLGQVQAARQKAEDARVGVGNRAIAERRDWCFALYPPDQIKGLAVEISSRLAASPS